MRFLIYREASGAPVREVDASIIEDVRHGLDEGLNVIPFPSGPDMSSIYVADGEIVPRADFPEPTTAVNIIIFESIPAGTHVLLNGMAGAIADGAAVEIEMATPGQHRVTLINAPAFITREWVFDADPV